MSTNIEDTMNDALGEKGAADGAVPSESPPPAAPTAPPGAPQQSRLWDGAKWVPVPEEEKKKDPTHGPRTDLHDFEENGVMFDAKRPEEYAPGRHADMARWATQMYKALGRTGRIYCHAEDRSLWMIPDRRPPYCIESALQLRAILPHLVNVQRVVGVEHHRDGRNEDRAAIARLDADDVTTLFHDDLARDFLPTLTMVVTRPAVARGVDGRLHLIEEGYNPLTGIYYAHPEGAPRIQPSEDGLRALDRALSGVPFKSQADRANTVAWLLGGVLLDHDLERPMLTVSANTQSVGKSSLVAACAKILTGEWVSSVGHREDELPKRIGTEFRKGSRIIFVDNVTTTRGQAFRSTELARLLTETGFKTVRQLGENTNIAQSNVLFALTANDCRLDRDLSTRALPVRLYRETRGKMTPFVRHEARDHHAEIYGYLLWLALHGETDLQPPEEEHHRFSDWLDFVYSRVVPRFGPLSLTARDFDEEVIDLFAWGADHLGREFGAADLAEELHQEGPAVELGSIRSRYAALRSLFARKPNARARATAAGILLRTNLGAFEVAPGQTVLLAVVGKDAHGGPRYQFDDAPGAA
jgi:hypothetical protein